jgi:hypothetical protein
MNEQKPTRIMQYIYTYQRKIYLRIGGDWWFLTSMGMLSDVMSKHTIKLLDLQYAADNLPRDENANV